MNHHDDDSGMETVIDESKSEITEHRACGEVPSCMHKSESHAAVRCPPPCPPPDSPYVLVLFVYWFTAVSIRGSCARFDLKPADLFKPSSDVINRFGGFATGLS